MPAKKSEDKKPKKKKSGKTSGSSRKSSTPKKKPVKKKAKTTKKETKKKTISKQKRQEIEKAASAIPEIIAEQMWDAAKEYSEQRQAAARERKPKAGQTHRLSTAELRQIRKKRRLLWGTIVFISLFLVSLWYLNMRTLLYDIGQQDHSENLLAKVRADFDTIINSPEFASYNNLVIPEDQPDQPVAVVTTTPPVEDTRLQSIIAALTASTTTSTVAVEEQEQE